jgi:hypothetical protein
MEMRFFVRILGALTPPPRIEVPVMKIPLQDHKSACGRTSKVWEAVSYQAAPTTDSPMQRAIPRSAQAYGETVSRNCPTCEPMSISIFRSAHALEDIAYIESLPFTVE